MRVLYTDDGTATGEQLILALGAHGLIVDRVRNGAEALRRSETAAYDAIVLDVGMTSVDGWFLLREIRQRVRTPVLLLTAGASMDAGPLDGDLGADDHLARPFGFPELLARLGAIVHRGGDCDRGILRMADLDVDLARRRVERGGRRVDLTAREYALLLLLMSRRGRAVTRSVIAEQVWDGRHVNAESVELAVGHLRRKIDAPFASKLIHTARGAGYLMEEHGC